MSPICPHFSDNSRGTEFHHNIVSYAAPESMAIYCGRQAAHTIVRWDHNLYWHAGQEVRVFAPGNEPYAQWFRPWTFWRELGFDQASRIADPQFVDAARHDYRLRPTSPALELGFEPIDLSTVGPRRPASFLQAMLVGHRDAADDRADDAYEALVAAAEK